MNGLKRQPNLLSVGINKITVVVIRNALNVCEK
jgi:hypothetical protein